MILPVECYGRPIFEHAPARCTELASLARSWTAQKGAAGDGITAGEIWTHLQTCPVCIEEYRLALASLELNRQTTLAFGIPPEWLEQARLRVAPVLPLWQISAEAVSVLDDPDREGDFWR